MSVAQCTLEELMELQVELVEMTRDTFEQAREFICDHFSGSTERLEDLAMNIVIAVEHRIHSHDLYIELFVSLVSDARFSSLKDILISELHKFAVRVEKRRGWRWMDTRPLYGCCHFTYLLFQVKAISLEDTSIVLCGRWRNDSPRSSWYELWFAQELGQLSKESKADFPKCLGRKECQEDDWRLFKILRDDPEACDELQVAIAKDDTDLLKAVTSRVNFDVNKKLVFSPFSPCFDRIMKPIDFAAYRGSVESFRFFFLNHAESYDVKRLPRFACEGGNAEIVRLVEQMGLLEDPSTFSECLMTTIYHHHYELSEWFMAKCDPKFNNKCASAAIESDNLRALDFISLMRLDTDRNPDLWRVVPTCDMFREYIRSWSAIDTEHRILSKFHEQYWFPKEQARIPKDATKRVYYVDRPTPCVIAAVLLDSVMSLAYLSMKGIVDVNLKWDSDDTYTRMTKTTALCEACQNDNTGRSMIRYLSANPRLDPNLASDDPIEKRMETPLIICLRRHDTALAKVILSLPATVVTISTGAPGCIPALQAPVRLAAGLHKPWLVRMIKKKTYTGIPKKGKTSASDSHQNKKAAMTRLTGIAPETRPDLPGTKAPLVIPKVQKKGTHSKR